MKGKYTASQKATTPNGPVFAAPMLTWSRKYSSRSCFDVGFLLLIVAEPVRLQFALPVLSDIVRDMLGTKSFPQVSFLVASHDVGPRTNILPNVGLWDTVE
jgi:hypothetical protein